jgi:hypothetical protein
MEVHTYGGLYHFDTFALCTHQILVDRIAISYVCTVLLQTFFF